MEIARGLALNLIKRLHCTVRLRHFTALLGLLILSGSVEAARFAGEAFTLGVGGRGLAMGGAVVAGPADGTASYWNPALMNRLDGRYLSAMHAETFGSLLNHDFVGYVDARPGGDGFVQAFGFYVYYLGGGGINLTRLNPNTGRPEVEREESHGDYLVSAALSGRLMDRIDIGATAKIIYRDIGTESGYGLTLDVGALYDATPWATLGLMVSDVTTGFIRYSGGSLIRDEAGDFESDANTETIYPTVRPGLRLHHAYDDFTGSISYTGDIRFESLERTAQLWSGPFSMDTHYGVEVGWREMIFGRAGFDIGRFTAGGGVIVRDITVDFAYLHDDDFDGTFRVSAGYRWGD